MSVKPARLERLSHALHVPSLDVMPLDLVILLVVQHQRHRVSSLPPYRYTVPAPLLDLGLQKLSENREPVQSSRRARHEDGFADGIGGSGVEDARVSVRCRRHDGDECEENPPRRAHDDVGAHRVMKAKARRVLVEQVELAFWLKPKSCDNICSKQENAKEKKSVGRLNPSYLFFFSSFQVYYSSLNV